MKQTECTGEQLGFQEVGRRAVVVDFEGGHLSSDGGAVMLREVDRNRRILTQFAACFRDMRDGSRIHHTIEEMVRQRVFGLALGYEDLNDHDQLRNDPMMGLLAERKDTSRALAGKSTLNRLELGSGCGDDRYKKIVADQDAIDRFLVNVFVQSFDEAPERVVLDVDTTDAILHGNQEGRHFLSHFGEYCYLPLYVTSGDHLLCARLREANVDAASGTVEELERIVEQIRERWPDVPIVIRADSGFCRDQILSWCEKRGVDFVIGLQKNSRLEQLIADELQEARQESEQSSQPVRRYRDFRYQTRESWTRERRVVAKAEHLLDKSNPRFVVTSLTELDAKTIYESEYCGRGDMENRIKEQKSFMFADRLSAATIRANQLRLSFSAAAYVLLSAFRRDALKGTEFEKAQCDTIRLKLLKIGARIRVTTRRIWISLSSSYPFIGTFRKICATLAHASP